VDHVIDTEGPDSGPIRVVVVDDNESIRRLLRTLIGLDPDCVVVGEASDGEEAVHVTAGARPDVVLLDVVMPVLDGVSAIPRIREVSPHSRIVVFSSEPERRSDALDVGADAWLTKGAAWDDIRAAIVAD
jgi:DNA-binding NarL/FixJ family response regulator